MKAPFSLWRSDAMCNGASSIVRSICRMSATLLIARSVEVEVFGFFIALIAIETIIVSLVSSICTAPIAVVISGSHARFSAIVTDIAERMQLYLTAAIIVLLTPTLFMLNPSQQGLALLFTTHLLLVSSFNARRASCTARFRSKAMLIAEIFVGLIPVSILLTSHAHSYELLGHYWISTSITTLVCCSFLRSHEGRSTSTHARRVIFASLLNRGLKMLYGSIALSLQARTQPLILGTILGSFGIGMYGAINMFAAPARMSSMCVRSIALPRLVQRIRRNPSVGLLTTNRRALVSLTFLSLIPCLCILPFSSWLIGITIGQAYIESAIALPLVLWTGIIGLISTYMVCESQALDYIGSTSMCRWIAAGISLGFLYPLCLYTGVFGAFISVALGELAMIIALHLQIYKLRKTEKIPDNSFSFYQTNLYPNNIPTSRSRHECELLTS
ncbi:MAG: hypothetical protein P1U42_12230 [Phycisphaerales bacterium]|nr:hypothetical protein [Phycisphaerales bacterium]